MMGLWTCQSQSRKLSLSDEQTVAFDATAACRCRSEGAFHQSGGRIRRCQASARHGLRTDAMGASDIID